MSKYFVSEEDKALFRSAVRSLKSQESSETSASSHLTLALSDYYSDEVLADEILSFYRYPLSVKQRKALKQGHYRWQACLDLHGLPPEQAKDRLIHFFQEASQKSYRYLLLIHGKGGQDGKAPVLKNLVNTWLKQLPEILAFHSTTPRDGGSGALYVILRSS